MNVVFLTLSGINSINDRGIYPDLIRKFGNEGHHIYVVRPIERRYHQKSSVETFGNVTIIKVWTLNVRSTNIFEKGLSTLLFEVLFMKASRKYLGSVPMDLILYSTPPITFTNVVKYLKKANPKAVSYLLLKDIFPQNALDLGVMSEKGLKGVMYYYFRKKEISLYKISDYIGCMSPANVEYMINHNPFYPADHVEVAPNSIELKLSPIEIQDKNIVRKRYGLPTDFPIFIYGGNLGKPQGIDFLINCLEAILNRKDFYFVIVGNGTEFHKLQAWYDSCHPSNIKLLKGLPKEEYDMLVNCCDIGLVFLDYRFTIPNYPSRILSYLENKMPVICATDVNTDIGKIAEENGYGFWCESKKPTDFVELIDRFVANPEIIKTMGNCGYEYLRKHYIVDNTYQAIAKHFS